MTEVIEDQGRKTRWLENLPAVPEKTTPLAVASSTLPLNLWTSSCHW